MISTLAPCMSTMWLGAEVVQGLLNQEVGFLHLQHCSAPHGSETRALEDLVVLRMGPDWTGMLYMHNRWHPGRLRAPLNEVVHLRAQQNGECASAWAEAAA